MAKTPKEPLPPPLPPETRTVGQLVAESIRFYGRRFWACLPLGLSTAMLSQLSFEATKGKDVFLAASITAGVGALLLTVAYVAASALVADVPLGRRQALTAFVAGAIVWLPVPFLALLFVLPGLAWLAFFGLAVPVAIIERTGLVESIRRAFALGRADYVHALGSLATLVIVYGLTRILLIFLLRGVGEQAARVAAFLADVVVSPLLFLGAVLLYFDQVARLRPRAKEELVSRPDKP